jgi:hypothetical protein
MSDEAERRMQLLAELVAALGARAGGAPASDLVLRGCAAALERHAFLDPRPDLIHAEFVRLRDRLDDGAHFDKAQALELLRGQLLAAPLPSPHPDPQHRLLSLLVAAAGRVLDTRLQPSALLAGLAQAAREEGGQLPTHRSVADGGGSSDSGGSWAGAAGGGGSPARSLSDWGEVDAASERAASPQRAPPPSSRPPPPDADVDDAAPGTPPAPASAAPRPLPRRPLQRSAPRRAIGSGNPYGPNSLSVWLASRASGGHPARLLDPRLCFADADLVAQVLNVLKGLSSPGPAFVFHLQTDAYAVSQGVHLPGAAPPAAAGLLRRAAALGTRLRRLQRFSEGVVRGGSGAADDQGEPSRLDPRLARLPTVAAFAAAVAAQVQAVRGQLVAMELSLRAGDLTLLGLRLRGSALEEQAAALHGLAAACQWRGSGAATAAGLLDAAHAALRRSMLQATSQGGVVAGMLLQVFVASARPVLEAVEGWMQLGALADPSHEFFVVAAGEEEPDADACLGDRCDGSHLIRPKLRARWCAGDDDAGGEAAVAWAEAHGLRRLDGGAPAAPRFLRPLAGDILAAGKCALELKRHCPGAATEEASAAAAWEDPGLHAAFVASLTAALRQHRSNCAVADAAAAPAPASPADEPELSGGGHSARGREAHVDLDEWMASTSGSGAGAGTSQPYGGLPSLRRLAASPLDLDGSGEACPAGAALGGAAPAAPAAPAGSHPVGEAMRQAAQRRVEHAVAGGRAGLPALAGGAPPLHVPPAPAPAFGDTEAAPPDPGFDGAGGWGEWFQKVSAGLAGAPPGGGAAPAGPAAAPPAAAPRFAAPADPSLDPELCNNAPPLDVLLESCLLARVRSSARRAEGRLCREMLAGGAAAQLRALQELHLLAAPQLEPFVNSLLARMSTPRGVGGVSQFEADAALQDALAAARADGCLLPGIAAASLEILPEPDEEQAVGGAGVDGLARLRLRVQPAWPLCLLAGGALLQRHASLLQLLLQLRWVQRSLQAARGAEGPRSTGSPVPASAVGARRAQLALQQEMLHLVSALQQHVVAHQAAAGRRLGAAVAAAASLHDMQRACAEYAAAVDRGCLLGGRGFARLARDALAPALDAALRHCSLQVQARRLAAAAAAAAPNAGGKEASGARAAAAAQRAERVEAAAGALGREYRARQRLLVRLLLAHAAEAGAQGQEARALAAAVDANGFFAGQGLG